MPTEEPYDPQESFLKKLSYSLISISLIGVLLYLGKVIFIPLFFGMLLACLLYPVVNFLLKRGMAEVLSISLPLVVSLLIIMAIVYLLSAQIAQFFDDLPSLKERFGNVMSSIEQWISKNLGVTPKEQEAYINDTAKKVKEEGPKLVGVTFLSLSQALSYIILAPIYTFLTLFYRETLKRFFVVLFKNVSAKKVHAVIHESRIVSQQYIGGLLIETCLVFTLNAIGFLLLGIKYALFLALTAALLNLIPYIGITAANVLCVVVTFISSSDPTDALWVAGILALVQLYDNNIGMPLIVGNNVQINAIATILGIFIGGALCGVPGMFLAIPGLAVLKVIFDRVPYFHAWGILLGDETNDKRRKKKSLRSLLERLKGRFSS